MKALLIGDVHITDDSKRPINRKPGYTQQILAKLEFCVGLANDLGVPIVQLGDLFNLKSASKNSHKLVQQVHDVLVETVSGVWVVPGNHDLQNDRLDSLEKQPLGALCRMRNINLLIGNTSDLPGIVGVPYLTEFDGGNWQEALEQHENFNILVEEATLLCTHAPLFPVGQAPGVYDSIDPNLWADYWSGISATAYGHIHDPANVFMDSKSTMQFANFGAISRGSLHAETVNRQLKVALWTGSAFEPYAIPFEKPEEVFLFDKAIERAARKATAKNFSEAFESAKLNFLTTDEIFDSLRPRVSTPKVLKVIENALESNA